MRCRKIKYPFLNFKDSDSLSKSIRFTFPDRMCTSSVPILYSSALISHPSNKM